LRHCSPIAKKAPKIIQRIKYKTSRIEGLIENGAYTCGAFRIGTGKKKESIG